MFLLADFRRVMYFHQLLLGLAYYLTSCITRGAQGGFMGSAGLVYGAHKTGLRGAQGWFTVRVYGLSHDRFPTAGLWGAHNGFMGCTGRVYGLGHLVSNGGFTGFTG